MIYCINPWCTDRLNPDDAKNCHGCGTDLLVNHSYHLLRPFRSLNAAHNTEVFEAVHLQSGIRKVLKVLKNNDPKLLQLFEREASVLNFLECPGIPKLDLDFYFKVSPSNAPFPLHCLIMDKIEGQNLDQWIREHGPISVQQAHDWLTQLTEILDCLHKASYFHRDIKPSNIMLQPDGKLALIDFGTVRDSTSPTYLAKISSQENTTGIAASTDITIFYSPGYTPPEQFNGKALPQSDFYALGRTFIYLLTSSSPENFSENADTGQLLWKSGLHIQKSFGDLIDWMIYPDPTGRPKSTRILLHELKQRKPHSTFVRRFAKSPYSWLTWIGTSLLFLLVGYNTLNLLREKVSTVYVGMGEQGEKLINFDNAKQDYLSALWWNPQNGNAYYKLGLVCKQQEDYGCARRNFEQALRFGLGNDWTVYLNIGDLFDDQGQLEKAEELYQISREKAGDVAGRPLNNLARIKNIQKKYDEAISLSDEGLETKGLVDDTLGALYKNKAWAYIGKKDPAKAIPLLQKSISAYPNRPDIYCLNVEAKAALNLTVRGTDDLKNCFHLESNLPEVRQMRDNLVNRFLIDKSD